MMEAMMVTEYGKPLRQLSHPIPVPHGNEVVLQTQFAGVCHSDCHIHEGSMPKYNKFPFSLGHEIEGVVVAVGDSLKLENFMGIRFAVYPWLGCGKETCAYCSKGTGKEYLCMGAASQRFCDGRSIYGGYSSHVLVPNAKFLIEIPDAVTPGLGCVYMCSGLTSYSALKKLGDVKAGDLLIVGIGGVGLQAVIFAHALFGFWPIVADVSAEKRSFAESLGCVAVDPSDSKTCRVAIRKASSGGAGVLKAIDFVGMEQTFECCSSAMRAGGQIVLVGLFGGSTNVEFFRMIVTERSICGSITGSFEEALEMMQLLSKAKVMPPVHNFRSIVHANEALADIRAGNVLGRTILRHDWQSTTGTKL
eukprot:m.148636 g.148636  ORF g.148636 m.148636 type:complete len:362 (+) comp30610_c0_seq2:141-1226(+)